MRERLQAVKYIVVARVRAVVFFARLTCLALIGRAVGTRGNPQAEEDGWRLRNGYFYVVEKITEDMWQDVLAERLFLRYGENGSQCVN